MVDPGLGALVLSGVTAVGLIVDKLVLRRNSRDATGVQQQQVGVSVLSAQATAMKNEADVEINWRHEASSLQKELHEVRNEMLGLKRDFKNLQLDFDVVRGKLTTCQRENLHLREIADMATGGRDRWRQAAKSAWQVIDDGEQGRFEPEYRRLADLHYIEALNADDAARARETALQTNKTSEGEKDGFDGRFESASHVGGN